MKLDAYLVRTIRSAPGVIQFWKSCKDLTEMLDVGVPTIQRKSSACIEILQRVEADSVNTWDVYTIFGEWYLGNGDSTIMSCECRDGFAFKKVAEFQEMGVDMHVHAYRHCSLESYGIEQEASSATPA